MTVAWSLAEQAPTLACLGLATLVALGCAVLARGPGVGASGSAVTALAAGGLAAAALLAAGVPARWAAFGVLTVAGGAVAVAAALHRFSGSRRARSSGTPPGATLGEVGGPFHGIATEGAASVLAVAAVAMTARHGTPLSLALAGTGLLAMATALRRDRRVVAYVGACLLLVATWVQLATRQVTAPVHGAAVGARAAARLVAAPPAPALSSWLAYAPGLVVTLAPSLVAVWPDAGWIRAVLLGTAALAVTLVGARARLQAPLLIGGAVVAALAGRELTPFIMELVAAVPRWVPLALGGLVLLFAGATYERRLQDVRRLHGYISSMQ